MYIGGTGQSLLTTSFINATPNATPPSSTLPDSAQQKPKSKKDKQKKGSSKAKVKNEATVYVNDGISSDDKASLEVVEKKKLQKSNAEEDILVITNSSVVGTNDRGSSQASFKEVDKDKRAIVDDGTINGAKLTEQKSIGSKAKGYEEVEAVSSRNQLRSDNADKSESGISSESKSDAADLNKTDVDQHTDKKKFFVAGKVRAALEEVTLSSGKVQSSTIKTTSQERQQQNVILEPASSSTCEDEPSKLVHGGNGMENGAMGNGSMKNGILDMARCRTEDIAAEEDLTVEEEQQPEGTAEDDAYEEQNDEDDRQPEEKNAKEDTEEERGLHQPQQDRTYVTTANKQQVTQVPKSVKDVNTMESTGGLEYATEGPSEERSDVSQQKNTKECFAYSDDKHLEPQYSPQLDEQPKRLEHFPDNDQSDEDIHQYYPEPDYSPARDQGEGGEPDTHYYPDQDWRDSYHSNYSHEYDDEIQDYPEPGNYHSPDSESEHYLDHDDVPEGFKHSREDYPEPGVCMEFPFPISSSEDYHEDYPDLGSNKVSFDSRYHHEANSQLESHSHATPNDVRDSSGRMMMVEDCEELEQDCLYDDSDTVERMQWRSSSESLESAGGEVNSNEVTRDEEERNGSTVGSQKGRGRMGGAWEREEGSGEARAVQEKEDEVDAPRDLLFFMRDRKSLSEISQVSQ